MAITKTAGLDRTQALALLDGLLETFQNSCNQINPPNSADFERYLATDFQIASNGQTVAKSLAEYMKRITKFRNKYVKFEITELLIEPLLIGNKIVSNYKVDLTTRNGQTLQVYIMAIGLIRDNKFSQWLQVASEKVPAVGTPKEERRKAEN